MSGRTLRNGPGPDLQTNPDRLFKTLRSTRRRLVLAELVERNESIELSVLAESLVEASIDAADAHRVAARLRHVDLPKLEDADLVEYDHDERTVALTDGGVAAAALTERPLDDQ